MKNKTLIILAAIVVTFGWHAYAQTYDTNNEVVQTFAGSGFSGDLNGVGQLTMFNGPSAIVADSHSNLFFWDSGNRKIKKITPDGTVTTFAGGGSFSGGNLDQGTGTNVYFSGVSSLTIDRNYVLWASGIITSSALLYKITSGAVVTSTNLSNSIGVANGICADSSGNIYLSTGNGNKIYRYATNGVVSVFAGSGNSGSIDGNGIFTSFNSPAALAADSADNIYVWDSYNYLIRKIDQNQNVTTLAGKYQNGSSADGVGTNAAFAYIYQMCVDGSGNLILAGGAGFGSSFGSSIRKMSASSNVVTMAGSFTGYTNGAAILRGSMARTAFAFPPVRFLWLTPAISASGKSHSIRSRKWFPAQILASARSRASRSPALLAALIKSSRHRTWRHGRRGQRCFSRQARISGLTKIRQAEINFIERC